MAWTTDTTNPRWGAPLIVVVDDDADVRTMVDAVLTEAGYRTLLIAHGGDAVPVIRQHQPALVILDLWMERIDSGVDILHTLHVDPTTRAIPVIVASAHPFLRPELAGLLDAPQYVFVQKPFPLDDLLQLIARLLTHSSGADAPAASYDRAS